MMKIIVGLMLSILSTVAVAEQIANVTLDRAWGLLIGDVITVQVELPVAASEIDVSSLPEVDARYGTWLYLKDRVTKDNELSLTYQIVNVPVENTVVYTPEFNLRQMNDEWITVPAMPLTIGSLLPIEDTNSAVKEDHAPILIDTTAIKRRLTLFAIIAVVSSLLLFIWHIGWHPTQRKPFAQATFELSRKKWLLTASKQPARILHTAFNRTANTVVVHADLEALFEQAPWLQSLEGEISSFYQSSANYFFTQNTEQEPDIESVMKLAKSCRAKEKLA
ncbi:MAG: hypothetical protein COA83_04180 [Methylophaga sp.]|nr:MAG: hypothetical protein COA83_04180 [Methylophaga sp.]